MYLRVLGRNSVTFFELIFGYPNLPPHECDLMNNLKGCKMQKACKSYDLQAFVAK
ncbi:hypothetical protein FLJC2902T_12650 [Flavobacterium limnosediminis JC2902]|uniref:Uncharacterized protein n=1 Tax=Flavobacterium limnosediminis JC2902 TaxID=1341181 RepID=V6SQF9_9FLAO|nr:hypothetical protein FLJC2902T_12650 [Flavobacterium limnosediminis JC2902]